MQSVSCTYSTRAAPPGGQAGRGEGRGARGGGGGLESAGTRVHGVRTVDSNVQQEVGEQD